MGAPSGGRGPRAVPLSLRSGLLFLAWPWLAGLVLADSPARAQSPEAPRIGAITFSGNDAIDAGALRDGMRLREPSWWNPFHKPRFPGNDFLASDLNEILRIYRDRGFPLARIQDAVIRYNAAGDEVDIEIALIEGPRIHVRRLSVFSSDSVAAAPGLLHHASERFSTQPGDPLSQSALSKDRVSLEAFFRDRGHALVRTTQDTFYEGDSARVVFRVRPGPIALVDTVVVAPTERTSPRMVRSEIVLSEGDVLTPKRLAESRRRLLDTGVFRSVEIKPEFPDSTTARVVTLVRVRERGRGWFGGGAGYSSADELRFLSEWGINNISGLGRRFTLRNDLYYSLDPEFRGGGINFKEALVRGDYLEPRLFQSRVRGSISLYHQWLREDTFEERILGYSFALRREYGLYTRALVSVETREVATTEEGSIPEYTTRFIRFDVSEDQRDSPIDPSGGRYLSGHADYAGGVLGGTNEFARFTAVWQGYRSPSSGVVLAGRLRLGFIEPFSEGVGGVVGSSDSLKVARVPWEERFRLGGSNSIRGYAEDEVGRQNDRGEPIGGLALLLGNLELRFPLFWIVRAGFFLDFGNVWADPTELKVKRLYEGFQGVDYEPLNLFYGAGMGLRFVTPVGPLRLDYGYKLGTGRLPGGDDTKLHVALGQAF